jgi:hypothetical protein
MGIWQSEITSGATLVHGDRGTFVDGDLVAGVLTISHGLNLTGPPVVVIFDNNDIEVVPDSVTATDSSTATIDLSTFGTLTGTWSYTVTG